LRHETREYRDGQKLSVTQSFIWLIRHEIYYCTVNHWKQDLLKEIRDEFSLTPIEPFLWSVKLPFELMRDTPKAKGVMGYSRSSDKSASSALQPTRAINIFASKLQ